MSTTLVINLTNLTQHPRVIHEDGRVDNVQIMPKKRVNLREGMKVCSNWVALNPNTVKIVLPPDPLLAVKASKGETA